MKGESRVLTVDEVAALLHVHRMTIYRLIERRKIRPFKVGRIWRFDRGEIEAFIERQRRECEPASSDAGSAVADHGHSDSS